MRSASAGGGVDRINTETAKTPAHELNAASHWREGNRNAEMAAKINLRKPGASQNPNPNVASHVE
jgi:hypothetical protein